MDKRESERQMYESELLRLTEQRPWIVTIVAMEIFPILHDEEWYIPEDRPLDRTELQA